MRLYRRLQYLLHRRQHEADLAEELAYHRQRLEEEHQTNGLSTADAASAARQQLGNTTRMREGARSIWIAAWLESILQDVAYACRALLHQPGFTLLAVSALGLGIGLNTSVFTLVNAFAVRPWPVRDPGRMVTLITHSPRNHSRFGMLSIAEYRYLSEHAKTLTGAVVSHPDRISLDDQPDGPRTTAQFVNAGYFQVLGVEMALGRGFTPAEDRLAAPEPVAVLSYRLWQNRYGGDRHILGRTIHLNSAPFIVIGVANEDFTGISTEAHDLWAPTASMALVHPQDPGVKLMLTDPHYCCSTVAGRLAPGTNREQAQAELSTLAHQFWSARQEESHEIDVSGATYASRPDIKSQTLPVMALIMAAVGSVLLLACANVSNLLLVRAAARQREIAVRLSLGAGRTRVIRQLLTESFTLALLACSVGLALAYILPGLILRKFSQEAPPFDIRPDRTVLLYAIAISALTSVLFGLMPSLRGTRVSIADVMKQQSMQGTSRFALRDLLLGLQVAISIVLLISAGLFLRGLQQVRGLDPGFAIAGVTVATIDLPADSYDGARAQAYFTQLMQRLATLPGSQTIAMSAIPPLFSGKMITGFSLPGKEQEDSAQLTVQRVSPEYFQVLGIPVVAGRNLTPGEEQRGSILINESMARRYWPEQNPIGQFILTGKDRREIVGITRDAQIYGLGPVQPVMFEPFSGESHTVLLFHNDQPGSAYARSITGLINSGEPRAVINMIPLTEQMERWLLPAQTSAALAAILGILALSLATVGVYGVIAYSVEQRRKEIGIRLAVGASPNQVVLSTLRANARGLLGGLLVGGVGSLGVARLVQSSFTGVSQLDPLVWAGVMTLILIAGIAASIAPARRITGLDPRTALHHD